MSHKSLTILGFAALLLAIIAGILVWQEYQQRRAAERVPDVLAIANEIPIPSDAVLLQDHGGVSVNEYSAVVWRYYSTNRSSEEIRSSLADHASLRGFESHIWRFAPDGSASAIATARRAPGNFGSTSVSMNQD